MLSKISGYILKNKQKNKCLCIHTINHTDETQIDHTDAT